MNAFGLMLVEDDAGIGEPLTRGLDAHGYQVTWARSGAEATDAARHNSYALILLDLGLPDIDGVALCRQLREQLPDAVIVALTARDTEMDVIVTLQAGADDYLIKPFRFGELLARLDAHLRRSKGSKPARAERGPVEALSVGKVVLDPESHKCTVGGETVELRPREFELLEILMENAGRALSRDRLMLEVWGEDWYGSTKTLDMHIAMLRRHLTDNGEDANRIVTLRGFGYRYESDASD